MHWRRFGAGIAIAGTLASTVPIVPEPMEWRVSYETIQFETQTGDLAPNEYAEANYGGWYVSPTTPDVAPFIYTENPEDIRGKLPVAVKCERCAYYSEFINHKGQLARQKETKEKYDILRNTTNAPQPTATEFLTLFETSRANAAIAFDATTTASATELSASSASWSHTTTGSNTVIGVGIQLGIATSGSSILSVTHNSLALTNATTSFYDTAVDRTVSQWYRAAPTTGSQTVAVTLNATHTFNAHAITLTGVAQTGTLDAISNLSTSPNSGGFFAATTTTVAPNAWIWDIAVGRPAQPALGTQTQRINSNSGAIRNYTAGTLITTTAGTYTTIWTASALAPGDTTAISFAPFIAPATPDDGIIFFD